jgi:hypothetical protein
MLPVYRAGSQKGRASMHTGNLPPTKDTSYSHAKHETLWRGIVQQQRKFGKVILRQLLTQGREGQASKEDQRDRRDFRQY